MSSRLRSSRTQFSLFSFQDIITSVTGIMILVTLLLALELINRKENSPPVQTAEQISTTERTIEELNEAIQRAQSQLSAATSSVSDLPSLNADVLAEMNRGLEEDAVRLQAELGESNAKLDIKRRAADQNRSASERDKEAVEKEIHELDGEIADVEQKIRDIDGSNRVFFSSGVQGKTVWIVEVTGSDLMVAQIGVQSVPRRFGSVSELKQWLAGMNSNDHALFLLVKPGGAALFDTIQKDLRSKIDFGYQVVGANQQVLDPKIGAGTP